MDAARRNAEGGRMAREGPFDGRAGPLAEPGLQDALGLPPIGSPEPDRELVAIIRAGPLDRGSSNRRRGREDPDAMGLAEVSDAPTVASAAARPLRRSLALEPVEVADDPGPAIAEESLDERLRRGPAAAPWWWHGDEQAAVGVDDRPQPTRPGIAAQGVADPTAVEDDRARRLLHRRRS